MSAFELLVDCLKDATKERDELAAALGQATAKITTLEADRKKEWDARTVTENKLNERLEQLEKQVYLAGHWSCPKCKFYLVSTNMHVPSGGFSANKEPQACANGCGPMWRVTHEQSANTMVDRCDKMQDVIFAAREALLQSHCPHADSPIAMIPARKIGNAINALETAGDSAPPTQWTKEPPTEPGTYWLRVKVPVHEDGDGTLCTHDAIGDYVEAREIDYGEWWPVPLIVEDQGNG